MPSFLCSDALRRSQSINRTFLPVCVIWVARLSAVVLLPSPTEVLVTSSTFGMPSGVENCRVVRNERYASAKGERGSAFSARASSTPSATLVAGIMPSTGRPSSFSMSSGSLIVSSRCSSRKREADAGRQAEEDGDHQVAHQVRLEREFGHLGLVDHGNVVDAHPAGHADFLVALQQAVVELAVGIHLALQQVVLEAAVLAAEDGLLALLQLGRELLLLGQRGLVIGFERARAPPLVSWLILACSSLIWLSICCILG